MTKGVKPEFNTLIDRAALDFLKSKKLLPGFSHYDVWLYEHAVAFTVAKMMDKDMLAEVKAAVEAAIANGTGWHTFQKQLKPYLMARGWWGESVMIDPVDGIAKTVQLGSTRRLRTIFHTNFHTAHAAGQWARVQAAKEELPYLKYLPSVAGERREAHKRYYNLILPVEHPLWRQIFPPNGYGCLCGVIQLTEKQALRERAEDIEADPAAFTPEQIENSKKGRLNDTPDIKTVEVTNPRTGQVVRIPADITPSFAHSHGDRIGALRELAAAKHGRRFAAQVARQTDSYVQNKLTRPNFIGISPNLTLATDTSGLPDAQGFIYTHAGRGEQIGEAAPGTTGAVEAVEQDGRHYLLQYGKDGISVSAVTAAEYESRKLGAMTELGSKIFTPADFDVMNNLLPEMMKDYGDTDFGDRLAAFAYTTVGGSDVNKWLFRNKGDLSDIRPPHMLQLVRALDRFLEKAPKRAGATVRMMDSAGLHNAEAFMAAHEADKYLRYSNFTSTAKKKNTFGSDMDIRIYIQGKSGVDIQALSRFASESEVLMPRNSVYKVLKKTVTEGVTEILLEEVENLPQNITVIQLSILEKKHGNLNDPFAAKPERRPCHRGVLG